MTCRECAFFQPETANSKKGFMSGECRRFPPQVVQDLEFGEVVQTQCWPLVYDTDWCGEFDEREDIWTGLEAN